MVDSLEQTLDTDDVVVSPPSNVIAYNEQRSCADLFRLVEEKQLDIDPDFQRGEVWTNPVKTRFIDSLAKQLPIPSMCLSVDLNTSDRIVIDGLQRTLTIVKFLDESSEWTLSNIEDIDDRLRGKSNLYIRDNIPALWSAIQNLMIPITVIRCDYQDQEHLEYLYMIFHRLNTNSVRLSNQEVRNGVYSGILNTSLKQASQAPSIIALYGESSRLSVEEYLLRILAFSEKLGSYKGPMAKFLNKYMFDNRHSDPSVKLSKLFEAADFILKNFLKQGERLSRTATEGLLYGVLKNIDTLREAPAEDLERRYKGFLSLEEFGAEALSEGVTSKQKVIKRLEAAQAIFKG